MKSFCCAVLPAVLLLAAVSGCRTGGPAGSPTAPPSKLPDAGKYTIYVMTSTGSIQGLDAQEYKQREQVREYMEKEMISLLSKRGGFKAQAVRRQSEFRGALNEYLLSIQIVRYDAGNKATRMLSGYGDAGAASLDIRYEIYGSSPTAILSTPDGVGSGRDWNYCVRKLNENMLKAITAKIR